MVLSPKTTAQICADRFHDLIAHLDAMFATLPRGWLDAKLVFTKDGLQANWPYLKASFELETAHQKMTFESLKGAFDERADAFYQSCLAHPTIGAYIARDPNQGVRLFWKKDKTVLDFAQFQAAVYTFPWQPPENVQHLLATTTQSPAFSTDITLFLEKPESSHLGAAHIEANVFADIAPFLLKNPAEGANMWRQATADHPLWETPLLIYTIATRHVQEITRIDTGDTQKKKEVLDAVAKMSANIAIPYKPT